MFGPQEACKAYRTIGAWCLQVLHDGDFCNRYVAVVPRLLRSVPPLRLRRLLAALPSLPDLLLPSAPSPSSVPAALGRQVRL